MSASGSDYDAISTDFLILIGRIVIGWSRIERAIDVAIISGRHRIPKHFEKGSPISLSRKVKAFRALCNRTRALSKQLLWIEKRIADLLVLAEERHTIVHGFFHGISGEIEPQIYFRRASPLSGDAGKRLIATRAELECLVQRLKQADFDFMMLLMMILQDTRRPPKASIQPTS